VSYLVSGTIAFVLLISLVSIGLVLIGRTEEANNQPSSGELPESSEQELTFVVDTNIERHTA